MTTRLAGEHFRDLNAVGAGRVIEDFDLDRCTFAGSSLVQWDDPSPSLVVRQVQVTRCTLQNCAAIGTRFENLTIDHLTVKGGMLTLAGCVFSHVTIRGRVGSLMTTPPMAGPGRELSSHATQAMVDAYESVDWALDISEAEFTNASLYYVPGNLVRRDPETQFLLRRDSVAELGSRTLPENGDIFFERFETTPFDSFIAIAPKRSRQFQEMLEILQALREMGLAE